MKTNIILILSILAGYSASAQIDPGLLTDPNKGLKNPKSIKPGTPVKAAPVLNAPVVNAKLPPKDLPKDSTLKPVSH